jgi:hypothetical protein
MKTWRVGMLLISLVALAGCAGQTPNTVAVATAGVYTSTALAAGFENALPATSQLALGTLKLEGTGEAITAAQARDLLFLWQSIQSGALQGDLETNAVWNQIERTMTADQVAAIAAMQLTAEDLTAYTQQMGPAMGSPGAMANPPAGGQGTMPQGGPSGGGPGNLTAEQRAAMQATRQAGGQGAMPQGGPGNLTAEQMAAMRATAEAGGVTFTAPQGATTGASSSSTALIQAVVALLTQRAAG